ncbi:survivin NDAI_0D00570 [Naumovozyma dairenensis CBS 421]|uniref:Uncharacterized protein n=1 Tax=Naumovozyma dairenensis (strain ATCC 10597 / BCRC 20456 / CBS 421 / NBRC 0211 / NRRL Y-12639) TaxID=1071378 RepID=G0W9B0_NAUDC|nr:hypothetical protein NDAI_0D00570 [Naumovozyma dairenensis CBS 421]CCD24371.1 hypothetical protein NDAI_0D00570 [Naumovozyma dairenensis CBS 421]
MSKTIKLDIPSDSPLYSIDSRLQTFRETTTIDKKKFKWRYTVIPFENMSQLGFFYHPFKDPKTNQIHRDAVCCIYCHHLTSNFQKCRTKSIIQTFTKVLKKHLDSSPNCSILQMKLSALEDELSLTNNQNNSISSIPLSNLYSKIFENPDTINAAWSTFKGDPWFFQPSNNWNEISIKEAGLVKYDPSFTKFNNLLKDKQNKKNFKHSCYCWYCNTLIIPDETNNNLSPKEHHIQKIEKNSKKCYFLERMINTKNININNSKNNIKSKESSTFDYTNNIPNSTSLQSIDQNFSPASNPNKTTDPSRNVTDNNKDNNNRKDNDVISSSPIRKKRKLQKLSPQMISENETSLNNNSSSSLSMSLSQKKKNTDKDLVVNFHGHVNRKRNTTDKKASSQSKQRINPIIDDSTNDEFSFSNQGHSTFDIPIPTSSVHLSKETPSTTKQSPTPLSAENRTKATEIEHVDNNNNSKNIENDNVTDDMDDLSKLKAIPLIKFTANKTSRRKQVGIAPRDEDNIIKATGNQRAQSSKDKVDTSSTPRPSIGKMNSPAPSLSKETEYIEPFQKDKDQEKGSVSTIKTRKRSTSVSSTSGSSSYSPSSEFESGSESEPNSDRSSSSNLGSNQDSLESIPSIPLEIEDVKEQPINALELDESKKSKQEPLRAEETVKLVNNNDRIEQVPENNELANNSIRLSNVNDLEMESTPLTTRALIQHDKAMAASPSNPFILFVFNVFLILIKYIIYSNSKSEKKDPLPALLELYPDDNGIIEQSPSLRANKKEEGTPPMESTSVPDFVKAGSNMRTGGVLGISNRTSIILPQHESNFNVNSNSSSKFNLIGLNQHSSNISTMHILQERSLSHSYSIQTPLKQSSVPVVENESQHAATNPDSSVQVDFEMPEVPSSQPRISPSPLEERFKIEEEYKNNDFLQELNKIDENTLIVKKYFHKLLKYINNNDATLHHDRDGDLTFFINQMPNTELDMTFEEWIKSKKIIYSRNFKRR